MAEKGTNLTVHVTEDDAEKIDELAWEERQSKSAFIREALAEKLSDEYDYEMDAL